MMLRTKFNKSITERNKRWRRSNTNPQLTVFIHSDVLRLQILKKVQQQKLGKVTREHLLWWMSEQHVVWRLKVDIRVASWGNPAIEANRLCLSLVCFGHITVIFALVTSFQKLVKWLEPSLCAVPRSFYYSTSSTPLYILHYCSTLNGDF
jgi:hypothetical protein